MGEVRTQPDLAGDEKEQLTLPDQVFALLYKLFPRARGPAEGARRGGIRYAPNGRRECERRVRQRLRGQLKKENGYVGRSDIPAGAGADRSAALVGD